MTELLPTAPVEREPALIAVREALEDWPTSISKKELKRKFGLPSFKAVRSKLLTDDILCECQITEAEMRAIRGGFTIHLTVCIHRALSKKLLGR